MHFTTFSLYLVSVLVGLSKTSLDHNQFTEKASLCPYIYLVYPHHTEVSLPRQWSERSCICVLGFIDFASFYDFDMWFWNCSDSVVFFVSLFYCRLIEANCDVYCWVWCIPAVYEWKCIQTLIVKQLFKKGATFKRVKLRTIDEQK